MSTSTTLTTLTTPRTSYEKLLPAIAKRLDSLEKALPLPATTKSFRPIANPAPLGLLGFALVSILAAIPKLEDRAKDTSQLIFVVAFFLGGLAQVIAALLEFSCNHLHAASTFALFGLHWSAQAILILSKSLKFTTFDPLDAHDGAVYYTTLTVAAIMLTIPSFRMNRVLTGALVCVVFAFGFDVPAAFGHRWAEVGSAVAAIAASILAMYMAFVEFVNEAWDRQLLSVFPVRSVK